MKEDIENRIELKKLFKTKEDDNEPKKSMKKNKNKKNKERKEMKIEEMTKKSEKLSLVIKK